MDTGFLNVAESPRLLARNLYWMGWRVARIAELIDEKPGAVHNWKRREGWDNATAYERVSGALEARMVKLISKDDKEGRDFKELDLLSRQMERVARVERYKETGNAAEVNPKLGRGGRASGEKRRKARKNELSDEQVEMVSKAFWDSLYPHQKAWYRAGLKNRIRDILKSRQIGATLFFAREGIVDALETGKNKIFLSASKAQAHIFREYITQFVYAHTEVELKGDPIVLGNGATLYFLGTNSKTAQGYHGDVYVDEYFWIQRFQEFRKVVSGMAAQNKWRQTYFSTPSSIAHEAYPFWSGDLYNRGRKKADQIKLDVSHAALSEGRLCADNHWRQIVTIDDALARGFDLFDIEQLQLEYSPEEFENLFRCEFVDDTLSAFPLAALQPCMVDSWEGWDDFRPFAPRPMGDAPVWIGYDPAGDGDGGDGAGLVVTAPPAQSKGKHRIIERERLHGQDYEAQATAIQARMERYNVQHIGIDITGMGEAVAQIVERFFPTVTRIRYDPAVKSQMVLQAQQLMRKHRLEFDAGWSDLAQSFMAIRKALTAGGSQFTYQAGRNGETGHADLAWATMHALQHEPLDAAGAAEGSSILEIYG